MKTYRIHPSHLTICGRRSDVFVIQWRFNNYGKWTNHKRLSGERIFYFNREEAEKFLTKMVPMVWETGQLNNIRKA